jgi:hypothetical protein
VTNRSFSTVFVASSVDHVSKPASHSIVEMSWPSQHNPRFSKHPPLTRGLNSRAGSLSDSLRVHTREPGRSHWSPGARPSDVCCFSIHRTNVHAGWNNGIARVVAVRAPTRTRSLNFHRRIYAVKTGTCSRRNRTP